MCMAAMGGLLSAGIGAMGQIAAYNAQVEEFNAQENMWKENYTNSLAAGRDEYNQLISRGVQENEATAHKMGQYAIEGAVAKSVAEVSAASSGVGGNTVKTLIRHIGGGAARNRAIAAQNGANAAVQLTHEMRATDARIKNRINSVQRPTPPSPAGAMLNIVGGFVKAM